MENKEKIMNLLLVILIIITSVINDSIYKTDFYFYGWVIFLTILIFTFYKQSKSNYKHYIIAVLLITLISIVTFRIIG